MNILMSYQCQHCRREYANSDAAMACEARHLPVQRVQPVYVPMQPYPEMIQVQMADGGLAVYVLRRGGAPCGR